MNRTQFIVYNCDVIEAKYLNEKKIGKFKANYLFIVPFIPLNEYKLHKSYGFFTKLNELKLIYCLYSFKFI